ncbi:hypothetical protein CPB97_011270 [Podila verticillata]|nr:hypothetical protein CPB97_011270 [Podila verticillata]
MPPKKKVDPALEAKLKEIIAINHRIEVREEFEFIMNLMKDDLMKYLYDFKKRNMNKLTKEEEYSPIKYCNAIDTCEDYIDEQQALLDELYDDSVELPRKRKLKGPEPRAHSYAHSLEVEEVTPDPAQLKQLIVSALWERETIPVYKDTPFVAFEHLPLFRSCIKRPKLDLNNLEGSEAANPLAIMYLVHGFFEEYEMAHRTLLSKKLFDDTVQYYIRDCIVDQGVLLRYNQLIEQKLPKGDRDWAVVKETLFRALVVEEFQAQVVEMMKTMRPHAGEVLEDFHKRIKKILKASGADEETQRTYVMRTIDRMPDLVRDELQSQFVTDWEKAKPPRLEELMHFFFISCCTYKYKVAEIRDQIAANKRRGRDEGDQPLARRTQHVSKKSKLH